jgi:hypothetical protein
VRVRIQDLLTRSEDRIELLGERIQCLAAIADKMNDEDWEGKVCDSILTLIFC